VLIYPVSRGEPPATPGSWDCWQRVSGPSHFISNLAVLAGDVMMGEIRSLSATEASFYLQDLVTGGTVMFSQPAPNASFQIIGAAADWLLEAFMGWQHLPAHGEVHLDACTAGVEDQYGYFAGDGQIVTLVDAQDFPLSSAAAITNETFVIVRGFDILPQT
jgi:Peptidase A4 family